MEIDLKRTQLKIDLGMAKKVSKCSECPYFVELAGGGEDRFICRFHYPTSDELLDDLPTWCPMSGKIVVWD